MLRIGEVAAVAGVSTRMVRHYHRVGVLPEPARRSNGYRVYGLADVVRLLRVRQLVELGLSLGEVCEAVAGDGGHGLREILADLDEDLATQERWIRRKRERLRSLLAREADPTVPDEVTDVLAALTRAVGNRPGAERERLLAQAMIGADDEGATQVAHGYQELLADTELTDRLVELQERFERLPESDPANPVVDELAAEVTSLGPRLAGLLPVEPGRPSIDPGTVEMVLRAAGADMTAAQTRCLELIIDGLRGAS